MQVAIVLAIMLFAGLLGATISTGLSDTDRTWAAWRWQAITGLGAALLVPLFLQTVSSELLEQMLSTEAKVGQYFVFGGFTLLASISARRFIATLSERVLQEVKAAKAEAAEARSEVRQIATTSAQTHDVALATADAVRYGLHEAPEVATKAFMPGSVVAPGMEEDDPWAGVFGGSAEMDGRKLEARIRAITDRPGWCTVTLRVVSTTPTLPLDGLVQFYLHPSFDNNMPSVPVRGGEAVLGFTSWGAFTVGALCDGGKTKLELNLASQPEAPEPWRSR